MRDLSKCMHLYSRPSVFASIITRQYLDWNQSFQFWKSIHQNHRILSILCQCSIGWREKHRFYRFLTSRWLSTSWKRVGDSDKPDFRVVSRQENSPVFLLRYRSSRAWSDAFEADTSTITGVDNLMDFLSSFLKSLERFNTFMNEIIGVWCSLASKAFWLL